MGTLIPLFSGSADLAILLLRLILGLIFLFHGIAKFAMWKMQPSEQLSLGMLQLMRFLSIVEPLGAIAVIVGFLTQLAALGLALLMLGAIYMKRSIWKLKFFEMQATGWEFDLVLFTLATTLILLGPGSWAIDALIF
jgi:putative oxidoreductase